MTALFSKPKVPKPTPTPVAPSIDDAMSRIQDLRRRRLGRSATNVVGSESSVSTAAKALTGN